MKLTPFPTQYVSAGKAIEIIKCRLDDDTVQMQQKVFSIEMVAEMETHNSITKTDFVKMLRWIFRHYDFESVFL